MIHSNNTLSFRSQNLGQLVIVNPQDIESHFACLSFEWQGAKCQAVMSLSQVFVKDVRMGVLNAQKTDGSELQNTLEGTEHGKGAEVRNEVRKKGKMQNV